MIYVIYEMVNVGTINFSQVYQTSVDTLRLSVNGEKTILKAKGRHDPCVVNRAIPIVESMAALVLMDCLLIQKSIM